MSSFEPRHGCPVAVRPNGIPCLAALATLLLATASPATTDPSQPAPGVSGETFKIYVAESAPYRVDFEDLAAAGLEGQDLPSAGLGMTHQGHPVPVWVEDGGDGVFGPGDSIEFLGEPPRGWVSYLDEHTRYNVYFLSFDDPDPLRMTEYLPGPVSAAEATRLHTLTRERHFEKDFLLQRVEASAGGRPAERWYWAKLTHLDDKPFTHIVDLVDRMPYDDSRTYELRLELRGWSQPTNKPGPGVPDHRVEVALGGHAIAVAEWNGKEPYLLRIPDLAADLFVDGENALTLRVPKRPAAKPGDWLIDVVLLNWIEITYPRSPEVGGVANDFALTDPRASKPMSLWTQDGTDYVLYGTRGSRTTSDAVAPNPFRDVVARIFFPAAGETSFVAVSRDRLSSPEAVVRERASGLRAPDNRADYIMIAHRRLLAAIQPLAELHRSRGLDVEVVDVQDVYDEFTGGLTRPWALRDFLEHAYLNWQRPAPRFVLLVGDASHNSKNVQIGDGSFPDHAEGPAPPLDANPSGDSDDDASYTPYGETDLINRGLIPAWNASTVVGRTATDNYFVDLVDRDGLPDMAIGRLPVVEPADVASIVEKTVGYVSEPEVGPWRRKVVFLTNTLKRFHRQSRWVASFANAEGLRGEEIYSSLDEPDNSVYTRRLMESLNEGQAFVHYLGHGGRFIWSTGRRDLVENRDLFSLDHLDALEPNRRLPVVLSLTCLTGPYDHPRADSLGEKFLRIEGRGAIAVIASSQSNPPSGTWGRILLEELTAREATVGEALTRAKRRLRDPLFTSSYNLFGDPAVPVAQPSAGIEVSANGGGDRPFTVRGELDVGDFAGQLILELIGEDLEVVRQVETPLDGSTFSVDVDLSAEQQDAVKVVRAYAWNAARGIDAAGAVDLAPSENPAVQRPPRLPPAPAPEETPEELAAAANTEEILAAGVAWWSFGAADGDVARDRLDAHHGSVIDRVGSTSGPQGDALLLHGHGYVQVADAPRLNLDQGDFALQAWISTRQARGEVWVILDKRAKAGYHLYNHRGHLGLQLSASGFSNYKGPFIADGRWHHVAVTVDRDRADGIRWFVDGREAASRQDPTPRKGSLDNASPLFLGGRRHGDGNFVGKLDEVAIFNRALTAAEIAKLYRDGWDGPRP